MVLPHRMISECAFLTLDEGSGNDQHLNIRTTVAVRIVHPLPHLPSLL
jgi:hypothetical protein